MIQSLRCTSRWLLKKHPGLMQARFVLDEGAGGLLDARQFLHELVTSYTRH